ncbi:uricase-like [Onthophagus taurus]|uniref:uricase-like n=1 Tax=Onthophagus taurus TaxID=166361 RepID=UPI0039BE30B1
MASKWSNNTRAHAKPNNGTRKFPQGTFDYVNRDKYEFGDYGYGKNSVKLLHVERNSPRHAIREYEVDVHLKLNSQLDYLEGNNKDIVATDSQKNTVYILAKKNGIKTPEEFGLLVCSHFLYTYKHVIEVNVKIDEYPWERLKADDEEHNHAFVFNPCAIRFAMISQRRHGSPIIESGLKDLRVLKTTQSAFKDFIQDGYRTLPDTNNRIFSTIVTATWTFSTADGVDFDSAWNSVRDCIIDKFAGNPETGIFSPSVQNTLYLAEKMILDKIPQVSKIEMAMPNKHYFEVDMTKFPAHVVEGEDKNNEVYWPIDKPSGIIYAELLRKDITSKL